MTGSHVQAKGGRRVTCAVFEWVADSVKGGTVSGGVECRGKWRWAVRWVVDRRRAG